VASDCKRHFCPVCGSAMSITLDREPEIRSMMGGTLRLVLQRTMVTQTSGEHCLLSGISRGNVWRLRDSVISRSLVRIRWVALAASSAWRTSEAEHSNHHGRVAGLQNRIK
jgi:hypothetical protein